MHTSDLIAQLKQLPEDQRAQCAHQLIAQVECLGHGIKDIIQVLPKSHRTKFISDHLDKIASPYVFSLVLQTLPEEDRLEFANQHYSFFSLEQRQGSAALGNVLELIPEENRFDFALRYEDELKGSQQDWSLKSVLKILPQGSRFIFAKPLLSALFIQAQNAIEIIELLQETDRLTFYSISKGDYFTHQRLKHALSLISPLEVEQFLEINLQKMLMTFENNQSTRYVITAADRHPIYYSLQRAFNAIEADQGEKQKACTYEKISAYFNSRYAINVMPYNPSRDNQYIYLRELESKAVSALVSAVIPSPSILELITQYSGHQIEPQQCLARELELKNLPLDDLTWPDMIYLHHNELGLRGVTDDDMAISEARNGGCGDAVSLACFGMPEKQLLPFSILKDEKKMDEQHPQQKAELLKLLQDGIKWHLHICFGHGYSVAFELISRGKKALLPYAFGDTYRLGKCGREYFEASQVRQVILRRDLPCWDIESVYRLLVKEIKELRLAQEQPQKSPPSSVAHPIAPQASEPKKHDPRLFAHKRVLNEPHEAQDLSLFQCVIS
jgi:hypothetical protein